MDFGLILLIIFASLISNIIGDKNKKARVRRGEIERRKPIFNMDDIGSLIRQTADDMGNIGKNIFNDDPKAVRTFVGNGEDGNSLESPSGTERGPYLEDNVSIEDDGLENPEVLSTVNEEVGMYRTKESVNQPRQEEAPQHAENNLLNRNNVLFGIIMAEVLSPPKCRR